MSPGTLQRKYLARSTKRNRLPQAHPTAARAAAANQVQPPQTNLRLERTTTKTKITDRVHLTRFKPGFEEETETELARIFKRPKRTFKEDMPFYPWLPPTPKVPRVCFNLNFTC